VLKGIMTVEDWHKIANLIKFDYAKDNYFTELKNAEITQNRVQLAVSMQEVTGKYYSHEWVRKNVLMQSDEDIKEEDKQIKKEDNSQEPRWLNPAIEQNVQMQQQMDMQNQQMQQAQDEQQQGDEDQSPEDSKKMEEIRNALIFVKQMKEKGKTNRSMQDESKYKAAVQLLAKNQDIVQSIGLPKSAATGGQ